jgi:hypothetical protein
MMVPPSTTGWAELDRILEICRAEDDLKIEYWLDSDSTSAPD